MYHYVEDKKILKKAQKSCRQDLDELVSILLDERISSQVILVGSGARNMVTQNGDGDIDFDYNLLIQKCDDINDCRHIKEIVRLAFNKVMRKQGLDDVQDSTSSLTTCKMILNKYSDISFSVDLCIVAKDKSDKWYRLIHQKTGFVNNDRYYWNEAPNSDMIAYKSKQIKKKGLWEKVRQRYLDKKNYYLTRNDYDHPSFICYIEAVNEVYNEIFGKTSNTIKSIF